MVETTGEAAVFTTDTATDTLTIFADSQFTSLWIVIGENQKCFERWGFIREPTSIKDVVLLLRIAKQYLLHQTNQPGKCNALFSEQLCFPVRNVMFLSAIIQVLV